MTYSLEFVRFMLKAAQQKHLEGEDVLSALKELRRLLELIVPALPPPYGQMGVALLVAVVLTTDFLTRMPKPAASEAPEQMPAGGVSSGTLEGEAATEGDSPAGTPPAGPTLP